MPLTLELLRKQAETSTDARYKKYVNLPETSFYAHAQPGYQVYWDEDHCRVMLHLEFKITDRGIDIMPREFPLDSLPLLKAYLIASGEMEAEYIRIEREQAELLAEIRQAIFGEPVASQEP